MEDIFEKVIDKIYKRFEENGGKPFSITFTKDKLAYGDSFLIQVYHYNKKEKITFYDNGLIWLGFDGEEPMLLENVPDSFLETLDMNL